MASITQKIPSYTSGISQQPDELKSPGQLKKAKNVFPDVTHGLMKRPGGRLIGGDMSAYNTNSKWFHYYRDENEQYIGQVQRSDGELKMWRCSDGNPMTVNYSSQPWVASTAYVLSETVKNNNNVYKCVQAGTSHSSGGPSGTTAAIVDGGVKWDYVESATALTTSLKTYLTHTADEDLQALTLNDYTYITNRNKTTAMSTAIAAARPHEAYISLQKVAYANQYALNIFDSTSTTQVNTATRIRVDLLKSSNNYCDSNGAMVQHASRPSNNYTTRCDDSAGDGRDAFAPNVGSRIFNVTDGASLTQEGPSGSYTYTVDVYDDGNNAVNRGSNLYFRITTIGQSVPYQASGSTDVTYQARYTTTFDLLYGGHGWHEGDYFNVFMKDAYYKVTIEEVSVGHVQANLGLIRPTPTPFDSKTTVTAESILGDIQSEIIATSTFVQADVQQIGNGIYLTDAAAFNVTSPSEELLKVITTECDDVADLPAQCKNGYVTKVKNSDANEDDYFVQFFGENGRDGPGTWEECAAPERKIKFDKGTMPIQIIRESNNTFTVKQIDWDDCLVGDSVTAPEPSFIGQAINKMLFFRNRLVMLSDENVNLSQPGEFFNFWPKSAITYTATDNIDLSCSSEYPAIVYDGIQVNQGLVLFTKNQQFMLTTDSDVLSPQTAKINAVSSYNFNYKTSPISLGTTISFLDNAGKYTRFFEAAGIQRDGEPSVIEQSKIIAKLFPNDINIVANSRENSAIFFATKGTNKVYGFRYYTVAAQRIQQAWFDWELSGEIQHLAMLDDALYAVIKNSSKYVIQKFSLKLDDDGHSVTDDNLTASDTTDDIEYKIHLDNSKIFDYTALTYVANGNYTKFNHTAANFNGSGQLAVYAYSTSTDKEFNGSLVNVTAFDDSGTTKIKIPGDWTTSDSNKAYKLVLGYLFDMEVQFPTIYVLQNLGENKWRADLQSSLVVHRAKFSLGPTGVYSTTLKRIGKPDYTETFESTQADAYYANTVGIDNEQISTLPIYEKNTTLNLTLKSTHPSPATLYSMTWEGDYSPKYYKRV